MTKIVLWNSLVPDVVRKFCDDNTISDRHFDQSLVKMIESAEMVDMLAITVPFLKKHPDRLFSYVDYNGNIVYCGYKSPDICGSVNIVEYDESRRHILLNNVGFEQIMDLDGCRCIDNAHNLWSNYESGITAIMHMQSVVFDMTELSAKDSEEAVCVLERLVRGSHDSHIRAMAHSVVDVILPQEDVQDEGFTAVKKYLTDIADTLNKQGMVRCSKLSVRKNNEIVWSDTVL